MWKKKHSKLPLSKKKIYFWQKHHSIKSNLISSIHNINWLKLYLICRMAAFSQAYESKTVKTWQISLLLVGFHFQFLSAVIYEFKHSRRGTDIVDRTTIGFEIYFIIWLTFLPLLSFTIKNILFYKICFESNLFVSKRC